MTSYSVRKKNLISLIGTSLIKEKAALWETSASTLSQITGKSACRNLGEILARRIEMIEGLPVGWLDIPHNDEDLLAATQNRSATATRAAHRIAQHLLQQAELYELCVSRLKANAEAILRDENVRNEVSQAMITINSANANLNVVGLVNDLIAFGNLEG